MPSAAEMVREFDFSNWSLLSEMIFIDTTELSSAERYNPQTNQWQPIVAMTSRRSGVGLAVVNGQLYAVGGFDGKLSVICLSGKSNRVIVMTQERRI
jgi:hypothetical protein